jgi:hypothetical protein
MASASVPGVHSGGNLHYASVLGALGWSLCYGDGLRALFSSAVWWLIWLPI